MIFTRRGSAAVEAAIALPLIIMTVITMVYILSFMFGAVRSDVKVHKVVCCTAGSASKVWTNETGDQSRITLTSGRYIYRNCVFGSERINTGKAGLLENNYRSSEGRCYVINEKKFVMYADIFDKGT